MRRVLVVALSGLVLGAVASPAAASPTETPPVTFPSQGNTEYVLGVQGFITPNVFYRLGGSHDIVVVYDGGGPANPLEAMSQIEGTVWGLERFRFDRLVIHNGYQAPTTISYADLEARFGPRPADFGEQPLSNLIALAASASASQIGFTPLFKLLKVVVAVIGVAAVVAVLAFGLGSLARSRRRVQDEAEDRLFA